MTRVVRRAGLVLALLLGAVQIVGVQAAGAQEAPVPAPGSDGDHGVDQSAPPGATDTVVTRASSSSDLERRTSEIASELRCPVCQGVSVEDSPTDLARQMRATVRDQLAAGRSEDEVRQYFIDRYGEWILLEPKASGFNLLVYVLPWLVVLAGLGIIVVAVRRWTRPLPAQAPAHEPAATTTLDS